MIHTEAIENNRGNIKLVRIIYDYDFDSGSWIEFNNLKDPSYPSQDLCWDNDDFIFGKFYKFLKRWDNKRLKKKDEEKFQEIWSILTDDLVSELLEMLDLAIKKEWYRSALPTVSLSGGILVGTGGVGTITTGSSTNTTYVCSGYISETPDGICSKCGKPSWNHLINYDYTSSTRS
jgi:hypothetical protein